jgi:hypothetical protein
MRISYLLNETKLSSLKGPQLVAKAEEGKVKLGGCVPQNEHYYCKRDDNQF